MSRIFNYVLNLIKAESSIMYQKEIHRHNSKVAENIDKYSNTAIYHNSQHQKYLSDKININTSNEIASKIQRVCINRGVGIHPRKFCRRWFGLEVISEYGRPRFTESQILAMELEHGYREKCINLISRILNIKPNTIHRWGKGVSFDKIPADKQQNYEIYLGYVDSIRVISMSLTELDRNSLLRLLGLLEIRQ